MRARSAVYWLSLIVVGVAAAEIVARQLPLWQFHKKIQRVQVEPDVALMTLDDRYGLVASTGRFDIELEPGYAFTVTVNEEHLRIIPSSPLPPQHEAHESDEVWLYGCSFVWGWGVDDDETYAWQLQQALPDCLITNFASFGYSGTINAWFRLRDHLARIEAVPGGVPGAEAPKRIAVLGHAAFHDVRNVLAPSWRFLMEAYLSRKRAGETVDCTHFRLDANGELEEQHARIGGFMLRLSRSSALLLTCRAIPLFSEGSAEGILEPARPVTRALLKAFIDECRDANVICVIAGVYNDDVTREDLAYCSELGAFSVDISVDLEDPALAMPDGHPSPRAHQLFADKLLAFFDENGLLNTYPSHSWKSAFTAPACAPMRQPGSWASAPRWSYARYQHAHRTIATRLTLDRVFATLL